MTDAISQRAPALNTLQVAWLQEIGIDKRMLARYTVDAGVFPASTQSRPMELQAAAPVAESRLEPRANPADAARGLVRASAVLAGRPESSGMKQNVPHASGATPEMPQNWEALQAHIAVCEACGLHSCRSQTVFGTGAAQSPEWMVVGEAPGEHDDRVGQPFQGRPGALLRAMLSSIGVPAESAVFFTNLIKCRPLSNRTPTSEEIAACLPYLRRQITLLKPRRILALGKLAAQALLGGDADLDQLRGRVHHIRCETGREIALVATYHPASLLLRPQHKADAWQDLNLARSIS